MRLIFSFIFLILINLSGGFSNNSDKDTLKISLKDAEERFLKNNLELLAGKYNIDIAKAQILQAKLWANPNISIEQNAYNQETHKYFDISGKGETAINLDQLIFLAGKRNKRIRLEKINTQNTEYDFYDLLRALKYQLRTNFNDLYFLQKNIEVYEFEIDKLKNLVTLYDIQYHKGNISLKETTRLKAELFSLENDKKTILDSITQKQGIIKLMIRDSTSNYIIPLIENLNADKTDLGNYSISSLQNIAKENRFDLKKYENMLKWNEANAALQKSLAVPDLHLFGRYDHAGGYIEDYKALGIAIDLPVWNRNQGNIQASKYQSDQSKLILQQFNDQLANDILQAYSKTYRSINLYRNIDDQFIKDFDALIQGIITNYEKRNISLLEFIDYYETYKESKAQMLQLQNNLLNNLEEINYVTGKNLFN
ncbi:MAG: TolC family protein [Bacteroidota bacterium]|nr:TolC family protein [Bacteroidota bacterium]